MYSLRCCVFILFLSCGLRCYTQQSSIDSLKTLAKTAQNDSIAANAYFQLAKLHRRTAPSEHYRFAKAFLKKAQDAGNQKQQGIALSEIGTYFQRQDEYDSAYVYFEQTIPFFKSSKNIGNVYSRLSNIQKAKGNYVQSIALLIKSDSIFESIDFRKGRLASNTNLGILLSTQGEYTQALDYYKKAEAFLSDTDTRSKSSLYTNFAITYGELGDLENSKKYIEESIAIKKQLNDLNGLASAYGNLALIASKSGNTRESIQFMEDALAIYKKINNKNGVTGSYNTLGNIYRKQGNFIKAEGYLQQANQLVKETNNHEARITNEEALYKLHRDKNQWDSAFVHFAAYASLKDSITQVEKIKISKELQTKYETDRIQKEKELAQSNEALAAQEAKNNKFIAIAIAALAGLLLLLGFFLFYRFRTKKKEELLAIQLEETEQRLELEQQSRVSELKALQSQMNPHFVFNALNSIQDLILLQDVRKSNKYLGKFSDLIRRIIATSSKGSVTVAEEITMLRLYTDLEQLRFGEQLQINVENRLPEATSEEFTLPPMFIQPYVENALKHGLFNKEGLKVLSIKFYEEENYIICNVEDNGVGRDVAEKLKHKNETSHLGFSTQANQERVALLNADKENDILVIIKDKFDKNEATGTSVFVKFPYTT